MKKLIALTLALALALGLSVPALAAGTAFVDVRKTDAYYAAVQWAEKEGVTAGVDATHFAPAATASRAEAVTFLWRMAGKPEPSTANAFTDVKAGSWYEKAVGWAAENEITAGTGAGKFSPETLCSRAMIVTMLYRMSNANYERYDEMERIEDTENLPIEDWGTYMIQSMIDSLRSGQTIQDVPAHSFYELPVIWAMMSGVITTGNTPISEEDPNFHSNDACTRGDMISFIYQFHLYEDAQRGIYPSEEIPETVLLETADYVVTATGMERDYGVTPMLNLFIINKTSGKIVVTPTLVKVNGVDAEGDIINVYRDQESGVTTYGEVEYVDAGEGLDCTLRINDDVLTENDIKDIYEMKIKLTITDYDTGDVLAEGQEVTIRTDKYEDMA